LESQSLKEASAQGAAQVFEDPTTAAQQALNSFKKLVDAENYRSLGFDSLNEATNAIVGEPLQVFVVRVDDLKGYAGGDPDSLLVDVGQLFYPVTSGGQTRSSIMIERIAGKWRAARLGNASLARQVAQWKGPNPGASLVQVPALGVYFIANTGPDGKLELIPAKNSQTYGLKEGEKRGADDTFAALVPHAKLHKSVKR
jgi:hypothetical protein